MSSVSIVLPNMPFASAALPAEVTMRVPMTPPGLPRAFYVPMLFACSRGNLKTSRQTFDQLALARREPRQATVCRARRHIRRSIAAQRRNARSTVSGFLRICSPELFLLICWASLTEAQRLARKPQMGGGTSARRTLFGRMFSNPMKIIYYDTVWTMVSCAVTFFP